MSAEFNRTLRKFDAEVRLLNELSEKLKLMTAALKSGRPINSLSLQTIELEELVRAHVREMLRKLQAL